ncbi:hypothetical protein L7F22_061360 [Adiantum nelumboides]|nr:hypothetical protein [Adiantum nelumboides]
MATRSEQLNWQEIHLSEDEASAQGTHAVRFLVQQVEKAQNNSLLRPMLNNLTRAHGLQLLNYEPPTQNPSFQEASNEGNAREEHGAHSQDDASSGRSRSPSRRIRRPLEREDTSLRYEVQESGSKRIRSPSREVSSSPSLRGQKREREHHARRRYKPKWTLSLSSSPSKRSYFSSSSSSDGYSSKSHHKRRRHDTHRTWKKSRKLQKFKEGGKIITFQTYDGSYGATDKVLSFIQQYCVGLTEDIRAYVNDQKPRTIVEVIHRSKFDPGSTHNFISIELAQKLGIQTEEMGIALEASDEIPKELPPSRVEDDHKIEFIPGSSPLNRPPYRVSYAQQEEILTQVNELLEKGLARSSSSPFLLAGFACAKEGWVIPIVPEDIYKTAFRTKFGLYEYVVMSFGLTNAPATFDRLMEKIFCKHSAYTRVFFDDIIVHSQTLEEHKKHLQSVFDALQANRLFDNGKKSDFFFMKEIKYLGHIISQEGIRMDPEKLRTNDQSEIANSIVLDLLKSYVREVTQANQWEKYLPLVEYAYNNTIHTSTGKTPFEVIEGRPRLPLILKPHEKIFAADEEVRDIRVAFDKIKESIQSAQQTYKRAADKHRKPLQFKEDD